MEKQQSSDELIINQSEQLDPWDDEEEIDASILLSDPCPANVYFIIGSMHLAVNNRPKMFKCLRKSAQLGHAKAQYLLYQKLDDKEEKEEKEKWLKLSAQNGYAPAQYLYGVKYDHKNKKQWLILASEQGHSEAMFRLANDYFNEYEKGNYQDEKLAIKIYELFLAHIKIEESKPEDAFAEQFAYDAISQIYQHCQVLKDDKKAFEYIVKANKYPNPVHYGRLLEDHTDFLEECHHSAVVSHKFFLDMYYRQAEMYFHGVGTEKDYKKAFEMYLNASYRDELNVETYHAKALYQLYIMYRDGLGTEIDLEKAREYLNKSAGQNYSEAQYQQGLLHLQTSSITNYLSGQEQTLQETKLVKIAFGLSRLGFKPASDKNHIDAIIMMGLTYWIDDDYTECLKYWLKAKEMTKNDERADLNYYLGTYYRKHDNIEKSIEHLEIFLAKYTPETKLYFPKPDMEYTDILKNYSYSLVEIQKDYSVAFRCLNTLVKYQNIQAHYILAWLYWNGHGIEKNEKEAVKWYYLALSKENNEELMDIKLQLRPFDNQMFVYKLQCTEEKRERGEEVLDETNKKIEQLKEQVKMMSEMVESIKDIQMKNTVIILE